MTDTKRNCATLMPDEMPQVFASSVRTTTVVTDNNTAHEVSNLLAVERPLLVKLGYAIDGVRQSISLVTTMCTPGDDKALIIGLLLAEKVIETTDAIESITVSHQLDRSVGQVELRSDVLLDIAFQARLTVANSSCGVCAKRELDDLLLLPKAFSPHATTITAQMLFDIQGKMLEQQMLFEQTGGVHAAALISHSGRLLGLSEDVGRHNALDKLIGNIALGKLPCHEGEAILMSGRIGYELVQKTATAGFQMLVGIGAPTSLAVEIAAKLNMTLVGFLRERKATVYAGTLADSETCLQSEIG